MTSTALSDEAVAKAIGMLPSGGNLRPVRRSQRSDLSPHVKAAVTATFVGASSCDVAIVLTETNAMINDSASNSTLSIADVLAPSLAAATAVYGVGVIGDAVVSDASGLFADDTTAVYELMDHDVVAGFFALRVRSNSSAGGPGIPEEVVATRLSRINDVEMALTVVIGRTKLPIREVLGLEPGAVIELDRSAGAPADILLNGRLIAYGEVVVVDQDYAVRVTRILDVQDGSI